MECQHGQLARSCDLCEKDARIAELEALTESLQNRWASRPLSNEDAEKRIAELERWIEDEGERGDVCTFDILNRVCKGCRCKRATSL